jgi:hypothetical protein
MTVNVRPWAVSLALAAASTLAAMGCGTSAYEARVEEGMKLLRVAQMFSVIAPTPSEIPGTTIGLRLPKFIDASAKAYNSTSADPSMQGVVKPERLYPPFLKLPGLVVTYEMQTTVPELNGEVPYYCYLATVPAADAVVDGKPLDDWIQAQLATTFGGNPQWEIVKCPQQSGQTVDWNRISVTGPQAFLDRGSEPKTHPGVFDLYSKDIEGTRVLIGWRFPQKVNLGIADSARLTAGSIVTVQPGEAAAPAAAAVPAAPQ